MMLTWAEAAEAGPTVCGGKGYNLGRLARYGFLVPDGGVLPAEAYRQFLEDPARRAAIEKGLPAELSSPVRSAVREFLERNGLSDARLAIRSSATAEDSARASFAGIHRSLLKVSGWEAIEQAIVACYASLWTEHARVYRERMGFSNREVYCAVVICRMVERAGADEPLCAGVVFSADPRTGKRHRMVIDAVTGFGEAAVSGRLTPERFEIALDHGRPVVDESAPHAPFSSPAQLKELAWTANRIHWALGDGQDPQDIEWAHDGERLWIVQSRPITVLPRAGPKALVALPQYWSRGNLKDSMPGVLCEFSWSALQEAVFKIMFASLLECGYPLEELELVRRFHGRAYFDFTLTQWAFFDGFGVAPRDVLRAVGGHHPEIEVQVGKPLEGSDGKRQEAWYSLRSTGGNVGPDGKRRRNAALRLLKALWGFEKKNSPIFKQHIERMRQLADDRLEAKNRDELKAILAEMHGTQQQIGHLAGLANTAAGRFLTPLEQLLQRKMGARGTALLGALCSGSNEITSAEQGYRVYELARSARNDREAREWLESRADAQSWPALLATSPFRQAFARFQEDFGHRASQETDSANPRWVEDPSPLLELVREQLAAGVDGDPRAAAQAHRAAAAREIRAAHPLLWPLVRWMARGMRRAFACRELGKSAMVATGLPTRRTILEIGRRMTAIGQLDHPQQALDLTGSDFRSWLEGYWDGTGARELARDRRERRERWLAEAAPEVVAGDGAEIRPERLRAKTAEGEWRGTPVASGQATGTARLVPNPRAGGKLAQGEILVAPATDPGWTPLFVRASAVVMESGGYLSHGAIVAREFGLPAVVNIPGLLAELRDGERIRVDGDQGVVSRVR
jgi:phosphoenolpyruvate synthase/pyruvate phosphate dikinase